MHVVSSRAACAYERVSKCNSIHECIINYVKIIFIFKTLYTIKYKTKQKLNENGLIKRFSNSQLKIYVDLLENGSHSYVVLQKHSDISIHFLM